MTTFDDLVIFNDLFCFKCQTSERKKRFSPSMTKVEPSQFFVAKNWSKNHQEKKQKQNPGQKKAGPEAPENSFKKPIQNSEQQPWGGALAPPHFGGGRL